MITRRLILDRSHLLAILGDPAFYVACPAFVWLRDTAVAACQQYAETTACCGKAWNIVRPCVDGFVRNLRQLHEIDPTHVECVRAYLAAKKGYEPRPIMILYRSGDGRPIRFQF